jgi:hypothetical protein
MSAETGGYACWVFDVARATSYRLPEGYHTRQSSFAPSASIASLALLLTFILGLESYAGRLTGLRPAALALRANEISQCQDPYLFLGHSSSLISRSRELRHLRHWIEYIARLPDLRRLRELCHTRRAHCLLLFVPSLFLEISMCLEGGSLR